MFKSPVCIPKDVQGSRKMISSACVDTINFVINTAMRQL